MSALSIAALVALAAGAQCYARAWAWTRRARRDLSPAGEQAMLLVLVLGPHAGRRWFGDAGRAAQWRAARWTFAALACAALGAALWAADRYINHYGTTIG